MRFTRPQTRLDLDDALIPLINVVFLMLIFFMIVGQVSAPDALRVDPPTSGQGTPSLHDELLVLISSDGQIAIDGQAVTGPALDRRLARRIEQWQAQHPADGTTTALPAVTLKADAALSHADLRQVLDRLRAAGIERVRLLAHRPSE
jgi:biopolymer transport protein ExbD